MKTKTKTRQIERGNTIIDTTDITRKVREHYEHFHVKEVQQYR